ncbi:hypothetical protein [Pedobacter sp. SL55]|uniref:hypothetical protein n=1 Tax=Pedobacter sp. SL55 TaxID=2995161 RepID=UPI002271293F|nr:hypothetical protein [Pedobacter sp. SL55]WAC41121.1 hypothetical protein OVA16_01720 [Pedobacter sp. SL55]
MMKDKIDLLYLPYLLASILLTAGYTFLHWLFVIKYEIIHLDEIIVNLFIPIGLCLTLHYLLLRKRRALIASIGKKENFCDLIILTLLALPLITAQFFIDDEAGKLTSLEKITQIKNQKLSRFYHVDSVFIHQSSYNLGVYAYVSKKSGRYNWGKEYRMETHFVVPLFDKPEDTLKHPTAWLGQSYYKTIDNVSDENNKRNFESFVASSTAMFLNKNLQDFEYLKRLYNVDLYETYFNTIKHQEQGKHPIIFKAENSSFNRRTGTSLEVCVYGYIICAAVFLFALSICDLDNERLMQFKQS